MTLDDRLRYCAICLNRKMNPAIGLVCNLTDQKPAFDPTCPDFKIDQPEADRLVQREREIKEEEEASGTFSPEKKFISMGVLGGGIMIAIAVVWFVGGLFAGYIFYYPPILLIIGLYAVIKGIRDKNVSGKKSK